MPHPVQSLSHALALLDDAALAARAASGDAAAFRLIMERNNARLYRVARGVLRNDSEAEDVVQEAYLRAFAKLEGISRANSSLSTWLTRIALNEALGRLRRRRPATGHEVADAPPGHRGELIPFPGSASDADPERAASRREIAGLLERAIDALPRAFPRRLRDARRRGDERRGDGRRARHPGGDGEDAAPPRAATAARRRPGRARLGAGRRLSVRRQAAAPARPTTVLARLGLADPGGSGATRRLT